MDIRRQAMMNDAAIQAFTAEEWAVVMEVLFNENLPTDAVYLVDAETANRLRGDWTLDIQKRGDNELRFVLSRPVS